MLALRRCSRASHRPGSARERDRLPVPQLLTVNPSRKARPDSRTSARVPHAASHAVPRYRMRRCRRRVGPTEGNDGCEIGTQPSQLRDDYRKVIDLHNNFPRDFLAVRMEVRPQPLATPDSSPGCGLGFVILGSTGRMGDHGRWLVIAAVARSPPRFALEAQGPRVSATRAPLRGNKPWRAPLARYRRRQ